MNEDNIEEYTLSFSGCGFLCIYHAGVAAAIREYAPQLTQNKVCGASAGAIAAAGIVCNVSVSKAASLILAVVTQARQMLLGPLDSHFQLMQLVRNGLDETLPTNAAELCNGKLQISLTRASDGANVIVTDFQTREEVIDAIVCSSFIPFYCGFTPPKFRGERYYDGGISDNQPRVNKKTITVSPFSGETDICPNDLDSASLFGIDFHGTSIRFTSQNLARIFGTLCPLSPDNCSLLCRQGFEDALRFLTRKGLTPCARCLTIQSYSGPMPVDENNMSNGFRKRNSNSAMSYNNRPRMGSECDMCFEKVENTISSSVTTMLFPPIMQKVLDEAAAAESWAVNYLFKFRMIRYTWRFMLPVVVPLQYTLFGLQKIAAWIASLPQLNAVVLRFKQMILFLTSEIEKAYHPFFKLCYNSFSEINRTLGGNQPFLSRIRAPEKAAVSSSVISPTTVTSPEALANIYGIDGDEDSMDNLINHSKEHDAVLAFYYTDDYNQTRLCEIFEMDRPKRSSRFNSLHEKLILPSKIDENDESEDVSTVTSPPIAEDSGFSHTDDNPISDSINKRDAACSPVRQLANAVSGNVRASGPGCPRRLSNRRRPTSSRHFNTAPLPSGDTGSGSTSMARNIFSSDSDPETGGEMLFVTNRRKRNASDEYDGDPEQSDVDNQ